MAYKFEITCLVSDDFFNDLDYAIFSTIEKEVRKRMGIEQGLLPTELYQKAVQHALWTIENEVKEEND